jgi:hypothetical protein
MRFDAVCRFVRQTLTLILAHRARGHQEAEMVSKT